jgi:hypothetical protein
MSQPPIELQNGGVKCTLMERFDCTAVVFRPGFKKNFYRLEDAKAFITLHGWEVNINFIKGSKTLRDQMKEKS